MIGELFCKVFPIKNRTCALCGDIRKVVSEDMCKTSVLGICKYILSLKHEKSGSEVSRRN